MNQKKETFQPLPLQSDSKDTAYQSLPISRRYFLQLAAAVLSLDSQQLVTLAQTAVAPLAPQEPHAPYEVRLPQVLRDQEQREFYEAALYETFAKFFPQLSEYTFLLMAQSETEKPGIGKTMAAWQYWTERFYSMYQESKRLMAASGISNTYFPESVKVFFLDLLTPFPQAYTSLETDEAGYLDAVKLYMHYAYAEAIPGEFIHLLQNRPNLAEGITRPASEGISNVFHDRGMVEWHAHNAGAKDSGHPDTAVIMPILDVNGEYSTNVTIDQFNEELFKKIVNLREILDQSRGYLYTYTTQAELGISQEYPPAVQLLGTYIGNSADNQYHQTAELFAAVTSNVIMESVDSTSDAFLLAPLLVHGRNYQLGLYPEKVQTAINNLKKHKLLIAPNQWQSLVTEYTRPNAQELALRPAVTAHTAVLGAIDTITLTAYLMVNTSPTARPNYEELRSEDEPTATLHFLEPNNQGEEIWWEVPLPVKRSRSEKTFLYDVHPPKWIRMPGLLPRWISTEGRDLVISVKVDSVLEVAMTFVENFQINAARFETAIVSTQVAQAETTQESPVAQPSEDPATIKSRAATTETSSELSVAAQAELAELRARVNKANLEGALTFSAQQEVTLQAGQEVLVGAGEQTASDNEGTIITIGDQKVAKKEEWQALERRLNNILRKRR